MVLLKLKGSIVRLSQVDLNQENILLSHGNIWWSWPFDKTQLFFNLTSILNILRTTSSLLKRLNYYIHYESSLCNKVKSWFLGKWCHIFSRSDKSWVFWRTKSVINPRLPPGSSKVWQGRDTLRKNFSSGNQLSIYHHHHQQQQ